MKKRYAKKEDIPVEDLKHYVEGKGGAWILKIEDDDDDGDSTDRVSEFRQRNASQRREIEELQAKLQQKEKEYEGINPELYRKNQAMMDQLQSEEEKKLLQAGKIDEVVQRRTAVGITNAKEEAKQAQAAREKLAEENKRLKSKLGQQNIEKAIQVELSNLGVRPRSGALDDILSRTVRIWSIDENGNPKAEVDGKVLYGEDGAAITMNEFAKSHLVAKAAHLFEPAQGGGAGGGKKDDEQNNNPGAKRVRKGDDEAFSANLEKIAKGEVEVVP